MMRIAINGFGRIGKTFLRTILLDKQALKKITVAALNIGPSDKNLVGHLFKYDTLMGIYPGTVLFKNDFLIIDGYEIPILTEKDPEQLPWQKLAIDWVVDCSGKFTKREGAEKHVKAGAQKVLISAPAHGDDVTIIPGVNDEKFDNNNHTIVSLGSCTTNALLPTLKVLYDNLGLQKGFMTTVHAYTNSQALLDVALDNDPRRARAAALNIVPTSSGATSSVAKIIPELADKINGCALRVPVGKVSIVDLSFESNKNLTVDEIHAAFNKAAQTTLQGILAITDEPLVSSDFSGNSHSVIIDATMTQTVGSMGKVFGWYDNEWGYSQRLKDFLMARCK